MGTITKWAVAFVAGSVVAGAGVLAMGTTAGADAPEQLPDLQTVIPTNAFSIYGTGASREFRYTHLVYDAGPGPLEIQPSYDPASGGYRGTQLVYSKDAAGHWAESREVRVPDTFVYHAAHGHFHFPLAAFGLYKVAAGGGVGDPVAISPKNGFCIDDSYMYDNSVPNAGTFIGQRSSCSDPNGLRGIRVGAADEYDYRDPGQAVPIPGLPDGTYWFKSVTDPYNDFVEANEANNEQDTLVTISNGTVTPGQVVHPDTTPPAGSLSAPVEGSVVQGATSLQVSPNGSNVKQVDFLVDGAVVGGASASPWRFTYDTTQIVDGDHWVSARITDASGRIGTTPVADVTVQNSAPANTNMPLVGSTSADGTGTLTTKALTSLRQGDVLIALVGADGSKPGQTATVTGGGLSWRLVKRSNAQGGDSEVWTTTLPSGAASAAATSTLAQSGMTQSVTLLAYRGATGVGASATSGAATGAPSVSVTTTAAGSRVISVANDYDAAEARTVPSNQTLIHQDIVTALGDTYWTQTTMNPTPGAGTVVSLSSTAPTGHHFNMAAVEVVPAAGGGGGGDTTAPQVSVTDPMEGMTVSGPIRVAATAADNVGVTSVDFFVDGATKIGTATAPPFVLEWDTATVGKGTHVLTAVAKDAAGNSATSSPVDVTVDNSGPGVAVISVDKAVSKQGTTTLKATGLTTSAPGETIVAYVAYDGPNSAAQTATVSGGGLTWTLVKRSNSEPGTAEVWSAKATSTLSSATVTSTASQPGMDGLLTVVAYKNVKGTGVAAAAGSASDAPSIYLPGTLRGSWGWMVGNDWDGATARTIASDQTMQRQFVDTKVGDTFWVQSMKAVNTSAGLLTLADTAPTNHRWNLAAVELQAASN